MYVGAYALLISQGGARAGERILLWGDNMTSVGNINHARRARQGPAGTFMCMFGALELTTDMTITASHIAGSTTQMLTTYHAASAAL